MDSQEAYSIAVAVVTAIGILLNFGVVCYNFPKLSSISAASLLTLSTCAADVIVAGNGLIESLLVLTQESRRNLETVNHDTTCHVLAAINLSACAASLSLCFGLTLLRYLAIVCNKKYSKAFWLGYIACSTLAVLTLGFGLIILQIPTFYIVRPMRVICFADWTSREPVALVFIAFCFVCISAPIGFMMYAYPAMYLQVANTTDEFARNVGANSRRQRFTVGERSKTLRQNSVQTASGTPSKPEQPKRTDKHNEELQQKKRFLFQSMAVVATLLTALTPMTCMILYELITGKLASGVVDFSCLAFYGVNPVINPIVIYAFGGINRRQV